MRPFRSCPRCKQNFGYRTSKCGSCEFVVIPNRSANVQLLDRWCRYQLDLNHVGYAFKTQLYCVIVDETNNTSFVFNRALLEASRRLYGYPDPSKTIIGCALLPTSTDEDVDRFMVLV